MHLYGGASLPPSGCSCGVFAVVAILTVVTKPTQALIRTVQTFFFSYWEQLSCLFCLDWGIPRPPALGLCRQTASEFQKAAAEAPSERTVMVMVIFFMFFLGTVARLQLNSDTDEMWRLTEAVCLFLVFWCLKALLMTNILLTNKNKLSEMDARSVARCLLLFFFLGHKEMHQTRTRERIHFTLSLNSFALFW